MKKSKGVFNINEERLEELRRIKKETKVKMKGKPFKNLPTKDKDLLLETICKIMGLID